MAEQKKNRICVPIIEAHIKQIKIARKDLMQLVQQYNVHANKIANAAFLMDCKDARLLDVGIEVHNIRNSARSIKTYFEMMDMLLEGIKTDITTIEKKRNEWREKRIRELMEIEAQAIENKKKRDEAERKAIARQEKAEKAKE